MSDEDVNTFDKDGRRIVIVHGGLSGPGRILKVCKCKSCTSKPQHERHRLPPCGCHGRVVVCSCRLRDVACRTCGKVFIAAHGDWYQVIDPHKHLTPKEGGR